MEPSMIDFDGTPSSPFVTEVETTSRRPSTQWQPAEAGSMVNEEDVRHACISPAKSMILFEDMGEDKENVPEDKPVESQKMVFPSPQQPATPERVPTKLSTPEPQPVLQSERHDSIDLDLMPPPPSTRKATPKKTPLKPSCSAANTPLPPSRNNSYERTTPRAEQTKKTFQAGLDMRNSSPVPQDAASVDDTCFSTFSEMPDMTMFAKLGQSSYEARSERKCAESQARVAEMETRNEELSAAKDATFSGPVAVDAELKAQVEEQKAVLARLESEMRTSQRQQEQLMRELQQERIEKGDLVAAVDEMLTLQSENGGGSGGSQPATATAAAALSVVEDFRKSISRPSGLRPLGAGGAGQSRIGGLGGAMMGRSTSGGGGGGFGGKSRLLSNIERMGRTGGAGTAESG
ncbi:hypothetical protein LTR32_001999 [Rachicladosporium monterosium]|uniref:GDP/GTP exchange factor Sec2 N-terminal domain-containing protein n=1 Tax=Rachicladosporium monterosium TaxID=1507873 RepID=A0ABR0LBI3_9PEZI|nr:hypothetical protein LTR32_001999 [Rachicladosporium monterosium]